MSSSTSSIYLNPLASSHPFTLPATDTTPIQRFHAQLPDFAPTPLLPLPLASPTTPLLLLKLESPRCNLPAFKILGASWAVHRSICTLASLPPPSTTLSTLRTTAQARRLALYTATDGNHGRAVARMSAWLGIPAHIYVPVFTDAETRAKIASESEDVHVHIVDGDYDAAVARASAAAARDADGGGVERNLFVQDTSFPGYEDVPRWCVEGYSTLLAEIAAHESGRRVTHIVTPFGVGSLAHAVVAFAKSRSPAAKVITVEPETAACAAASLRSGGEMVTVKTGTTIMDGMCCASVSPVSWEVNKQGIDVSVTVKEGECHEAVQWLEAHGGGIMAGPCGAATLAGWWKVMRDEAVVRELGVTAESVVVLLCTEGRRGYVVPKGAEEMLQ